MTQKIADTKEIETPSQGLTIYIHTLPNVHNFNSLISPVSTENDEEFSGIVSRHIKKFSKSWKELSKM